MFQKMKEFHFMVSWNHSFMWCSMPLASDWWWTLTQFIILYRVYMVLTWTRQPVTLLSICIGKYFSLKSTNFQALSFIPPTVDFFPLICTINISRCSIFWSLFYLCHSIIILIFAFSHHRNFILRIYALVIHWAFRRQMAWARSFLWGGCGVLDKTTILGLGAFDHSVSVLLFFSDKTGLLVLTGIWYASLLFCCCHFLAICESWECSFIILAKSRLLYLRPIFNQIILEPGYVLLGGSSLRKLMFLLPRRRTFG